VNQAIEEPQQWCANKKLEFKFDFANELNDLVINTDKDLLLKAFRHLFDNAVKFTSKGSIQMSVQVISNKVLFEIKDSGPGIPKEHESKIFEAFNQPGNSDLGNYTDGLGLGLSIVKKVIDILNGRLWFNSTPGEGASFYLSLTLVPHTNDQVNQIPEGAPMPTDHATILLVEDDDLNHRYFETILNQCNVQSIRVADGYEAVKTCQSNNQIKLVLMDLKLPVMGGIEATLLIKSFKPNLPIIAVTAHTGIEERRKAIEAGCSDFLVKPVKKSVLIDKLIAFGLITS
jgi:CheY-like chemotaxis protein